jgi:hypothetical protein
MIEITNEYMTLTIGGETIATARFSRYAAGDDLGAWIVSTHPRRLFSRNEAITALTLAERLGDIILQQNYHKMSTFHGETVAVPDSNLLDRSTRDNHTPQSQTPGVR